MSNLKKFLNNNLPEDQDDLFMEKITKLRMEGIKSDYEQKLRNSYNVSKEGYKSKKTKKNILITLVIAVTLALAYFLLGTNIFSKNQIDYSKGIASYIENQKIHNYDITRGDANDDAFNKYQLGQYQEAIDSWGDGELNFEDSFYRAMSNFYVGNNLAAESNFEVLVDKVKKGEKFYPEIQLYRVLNLHLLKDEEKAKNIYQSWPNDSWMANEYRKIFNI